MRVAVIVEDRRLRDFLAPAVARIARELGVEIRPVEIQPVQGCRPAVLTARCALAADQRADVVVIGADAAGEGHAVRTSSHRRKRRSLVALQGVPTTAVLAVAAPSVEAWLLADSAAFAAGIDDGLGGTCAPFRIRPEWPVPRDERGAKRALGEVVAFGVGAGGLQRGGFEFADAIVARARLDDSPNDSLADWAREFRRRLDRLRRE